MAITFRSPPELIARIDAYVVKLKSQNPIGLHVTRADAARVLLNKALDAEDTPKDRLGSATIVESVAAVDARERREQVRLHGDPRPRVIARGRWRRALEGPEIVRGSASLRDDRALSSGGASRAIARAPRGSNARPRD
jgi:hypothetical protein